MAAIHNSAASKAITKRIRPLRMILALLAEPAPDGQCDHTDQGQHCDGHRDAAFARTALRLAVEEGQ